MFEHLVYLSRVCLFDFKGALLMALDRIPEKYLNSLSTPTLVVRNNSECLNHKIVFINELFIEEIGYSIEEIPDKNTWWVTAYPDKEYQIVAERLWELSVESYEESQGNSITVEAKIKTKHNGVVKYRVMSEATEHLIEGHYLVQFKKLD